MNNRIITRFIVASLSVYAFPLYAQHKITGIITGENGKKLPRVSVKLAEENANKAVSVCLTDSTGRFTLTTPQKLPYRLEATAFGYQIFSQSFAPLLNDTTLTVILKPLELKGVVVTGKYKPNLRQEGSKYIVDNISASIYSKGSDAWSFFRFIPVLDVPVEGSDLKLFGNNSRIVLLVNGKDINIPTDVYLKTLRARDIERIEIIPYPTGEYKIPYGQAGINIILKKKENEGLKYSLSLSDTQYGVNSQTGYFGLSYNKKKVRLTAGVYGSNSRDKMETESVYRYMDTDKKIEEKSTSTGFGHTLQPYMTFEYALNKKSDLGVQLVGSLFNSRGTVRTTSDYGALNGSSNDSTYITQIRNRQPLRFSGFAGSLNYTFRTDNKGSAFYADAAFQIFRPVREKVNQFDRIITSQSDMMLNERENVNNKVKGYSLWLRYNQVFSNRVHWNNGVSLVAMDARYDDAFGILQSGRYENDASRTNILDYDNLSLKFYSTGQIQWNDKFSTDVGIQLEEYHSKGYQHMGDIDFTRNELHLYPVLNLNYVFNNDNSLSGSVSRSIYYPTYGDVNPFKRYISPTTYRTGNPYQKSFSTYRFSLVYKFLSDFLLDVSYSSGDGGSTFTMDDGKGNVVMTTVNGIKESGPYVYLRYSKALFKGYWYVQPSVNYGYIYSKSMLAQIADRSGNHWGFNVYNHFLLSKKAMFSADATYIYSSRSVGSDANMPARNLFTFQLSKGFTNASLSLSVNGGIPGNITSWMNNNSFSYRSVTKRYWYFVLSYSLKFGNRKVKNASIRNDGNLNDRLSEN